MKALPVVLLALIAAACSGPRAATPTGRPAVPVTVAKVVQKDVPVQVRVIGNVQAYTSVAVRTLVGGELTEVRFQEGQDVKKGGLLFQIDPRPYQENVRQAEATLARDQAQYKQAEAMLARDRAQAETARAEERRYADLMKQGIVAQELYEQKRAGNNSLEAAIRGDLAAMENIQALVRADQAGLEKAKLDLSYCSIRSPLDGRTGSLLVNRGNMVKSTDATLVTINQVTPIYANFAVPEQHLQEIKRHMSAGKLKVEALIPNEEKRPETGLLTFVDNAVDSATGTIRLKATFNNPERRLWPGQFINVVVTLASQPNAIVAPSQAVQTGQAGTFVYVVKPDRTVEARPVVVTRTVENEAIIEKGLQPGETVVTDGQLRLVPGSRIEEKSS